MEVGINDFDEFDEFDELNENNTTIQDKEDPYESSSYEDPESQESQEDDIISELLKDKGITDKTQINFEDENGEISRVDWDSLNREEQLNILRFSNQESDSDNNLDDSEIELINAIRSSRMSPSEYLTHISRLGVENYLLNVLSQYRPNYSIDQLSDDELFAADLISKVGQENITDLEVEDALSIEKQNEVIYRKKIEAIRNEYRKIEEDNIRAEQEYMQSQKIEEYNKFAEAIENEIRSFDNIQGYDLNMDEDEMEEIYDFITGQDAAGVSTFGKALNDPKILVKMAWYALNGEQAIQDMTDYWTNEIKKVRENSYKQGIVDALNGKIKTNKEPNIVIKLSKSKKNDYDDLDDI